ncbi:non-ribosomal peptide synthetase [Flavobacterium chilense]|uniref:Non-ribosomal peptide synthase domain TIGR01720/amino acid adenylation domain-containing protein n=1 Tax=Flavobacterium chilense TaxID=946677 RepID=A0A1M6XDS4_9FLAO|nr:non-ribosomal peptide synthetase [Flavobacterium chilense]SHL03955.1 non-ribosomal peptide synthase domain TIGR01720/amino acid adenylation domain-containing protein [Flavobacterium chilense]
MRVLNSYHQQRLWFIDYFEKNDLYVGGPVYHNIPFFLEIDKNLERDLLKNAFLKLVENNSILRTRLSKDGGEIFQEISETSLLNIDALVIEKENLIENAEELRQIPFDFDTDYLIKCYYENKQDHTIVYFVIHHAIIDRKSIKLIENQFLALINNVDSADEKGIQFYNFSNWQNELSDEDLEPLLFHWKSKLKDLQVLYFSTDNEREQVHIYKANKISAAIDADKVKSFCSTRNISSRSLFLAAYKMAFARLTGLSDIVIGTWMDLRGEELENVVGPVENLVVLRSFLDQQKNLLELCATVDQEWQEAENFKAMPFDKLVLELNPKKDMSRTALFDILYVYESKAEDTSKVEDSAISNQGWGKYDFNLLVTEQADKFDLVLTYNDLYFNQDTVYSLLDLVKRIVESVIENETSSLKDISLVSEKEYNKLVKSQDFTNDSSVSIVQLFSEQVKKHTQRTGVTWSSGKMNYEDLDVKSNQFANYLIDSFGIKTEDKIAIILPKSDSLIVSILGVLKAGAAYVPIDPSYPEDRKSFMIEDADCKLIVDADFVNSFSALTEKLEQSLPEVTITGDNLAYIIYTSGTTGRPKGVMIEHGNVISLLKSCFLEFEFSEEDTWSFFHSYCFDFSIWEIFGALLTGGNVLVLSNEEVRNQELAAKLMADHNVTVFSQTPSAFYNFIALDYKVPSLRYVVFGGEALNPAKLKLWRESNADVRLINMYGITETTVHVTYKLLTDESLASALSNIGKPLAFANCYVLDQQQALLPYGRPGELYVSGQGVARGYLNRPEINAERFIPCPFDENEKMYRTGDLARFMPSGELEYLGRIDDQVKVRGYRIELDEIKKQIDSFQSVAQSAITLVLMPDGDKSIASYVAFKDNSTINDLKLHLSAKLPEYMIPAFIIQMDELPINANGKLDKTKLPSPLDNLANNGLEVVAPSNQIETDLFEIWKALLNTNEFGIKHNFFDLGGHSLKATRLISAIHKKFNVRLELKQIFTNPTLEQQALFIQSSLKNSFVEITKIDENVSYAISDAQRRLWILSQFGDASLAYNMSSVMELDEIQDLESFKKAIYATVERHEILRTVFCLNENDLVNQKIVSLNEINFSINEEDFSFDNNAKDLVSAYIKNDRLTPFNLENGPLLRTSIIKTDSNKYIFYYNMHHIISDGWSMNIIKRDILDYYQFYAHGKEISLPELRIQYKDYAAWQLQQFSEESFIKAKEYWLNKLSGDLPTIELPTQKRRPNIKTYSGRTLKTFLAKDQVGNLKKFTREQDGTLFISLLGIWNVLLYKYTLENDIIIGSPVAGRDHVDLENQIGFFVNTLVLRNKIDSGESFQTLYNKIKENTLKALENQIYPFDRLVEDLDIAKNTSRNPVFDIMLILQNTGDKSEESTPKYESKTIEEFAEVVSKFDLEIIFKEVDEDLMLQINYNTDIYDNDTIKDLVINFKLLLTALINNSEMSIGNIEYLSENELERLLAFNDTKIDYPKDKTIIQLFEEQVQKTPDNIALVFEDKKYSYQELNKFSNQFGTYLREEYDIKADDLIGIKLERSEKLIVAILGILKSGAAYVPIDPNYPQDRIDFIKKDTQNKVVFDEEEFSKFNLQSAEYSDENLKNINTPTDLSYVIYTSGTTGNPKGVMVENKSVVRLVKPCSYFPLSIENTLLSTGAISFDATILEYFGTLLNGAKLVLASQDNLLQIDKLKQIIKTNEVDNFWMTASWFSFVVDSDIEVFRNVKQIIVGGDVVSPHHVKKLYNSFPDTKITNGYGPTENTTFSLTYAITNSDYTTIPLGKPIPNSTVYILDEALHLVPAGVTGKIYVSGDGLARGYLNRDDLTSEKFMDNPFEKGLRMYDTGDLGRWLPDGNIEFLGRKDHQVKIRGFRIELGEIETILLQNSKALKQAVVVTKGTDEDKVLVAYYVSEDKIDKKELQANLSKVLPDYMLPAYYVQLDVIPLTSNGKTDYKLLPVVSDIDLIKEEYIAPRTKEEALLVTIWSDVLKRDQISVKDSFYNLGGDSIKSIQVVSRIKQQGYTLKVAQILRNPIVEDLAKLIEADVVVISQAEVKGMVDLTPIQQFFFESEQIPNKNHYNQSVILRSKQEIDASVLEQSIVQLVLHHDALRMVYKKDNDSWTQYNDDASGKHYKINFYDLRSDSKELELEALRSIGDNLQSGFNIGSGILFHIGHFRMSDGDRLALIVHHLVIDGVSWRILFEDLSNLYESFQTNTAVKLPLKTDSFQRWASVQKEYAKSQKMQSERLYWDEVSKEAIALLPSDYQDREKLSTIDKSSYFILNESLTEKFQTQAHQVYNTEINDVLLTGLGLAIREVFGVEKSVLKMEGHGREEIIDGIDIGRTVGWFTSVYPFVLDLSSSKGHELIGVKESLRRVPNKGVGYGILNYLDKRFENELLPSIQFNYLGDFGTNAGTNKKGESLFEFSSENIGLSSDVSNSTSEVLLDVSGMMVSDQLNMSIRYSANVFSEETIAKLITAYENQLINLIESLSEIKENRLTPSDLTYNKLSYSDLTELNRDNNIEDIYELSPLQQGLYYYWLVDNSSHMYFEQISYKLHFSNLNVDAVKQAYDELVNRYAILRTSFTNDYSGVPLQIVHKTVSSNFSYESALDVENIDNYLQDIKEKDKAVGFDFEKPTQMRLKVLELGNGDYEFIWSSHHILMDGWCLSILINDFYRMLMAITNGQVIQLPEPVKYSTYIDWLSKINKDASLSYWKNYLDGLTSNTEIPFKKKKGETKSETSNKEIIHIEGSVFENVKNLCGELGITANTFIQGVWGYLLSRYNNTQDVVFGSVVSGRPGELPGIENMVGLFINTIPVRVKYETTDTVKTFLKRLHLETLDATAHHYINLSEVQSQSSLGMDLINSLMIFENFLVQDAIEDEIDILYGQKEEKITVEGINVFEQTNYDFNVTVMPYESELKVEFKYDSSTFDSELILNLISHFSNITEQFSSREELSLDQIEYLPLSEKSKLLNDFNTTTVEFDREKTLIEIFEEQVIKTPDSVAVIFEDKQFTYNQINEEANRLGMYLREKYTIQPDDLIAIKLDKSERVTIAVLGILKSGGAYVPIDVNYPEERIQYMENDSKSKVVIDEDEFAAFYSVKEQYSVSNPEKNSASDNLAYIIYTSGTTGNPKGVMVENRNLVSRMSYYKLFFTLSESDATLFFRSYCFDGAIEEYLIPLLTGGKSVIAHKDFYNNINENLIELVNKHSVTKVNMPPSLLNDLLSNPDYSEKFCNLKSLKHVVSGGDVLNIRHLKKAKMNARFYNAYGPTENTIDSTNWIIDVNYESKESIIGKPILNSKVYILDDNGSQLLPIGVSGKIYVSGGGVARGYLNRADLTDEKFMENPFEEGLRMYDTGDLGRWLPDGNIEFLGRKDHQVKIRGFRIELGEIETILLQTSKALKQAVVVTKGTDDDRVLVAYYVSDDKIDKKELQSNLSKVLPDYMLPSYYVQLDAIPLTSIGKIDRKALPEVADNDLIKESYIAPRTKEEALLVTIWSDVLKRDQISVKDSFYNLGGDSIKSIQVVSRIKQQGYTLKVAQILQNPIVEDLAKLLKTDVAIISQAEVKGMVELTPIQQFFFESEQIPNKNHYNQSVILRSRQEIDPSVLEQSIAQLVLHHDALRMVYKQDNDSWTQYNNDASEKHYKIDFYDLRSDSKELELETLRSIGENLQSGFNIESGVLFHIGHFRMSDGDRLALIVHHLVIDGVSWRILFEDLSNLYQSYQTKAPVKLPLKTDSFQRWASAQKEFAKSEKMQSERLYWDEVSKETIALLPADYAGREKLSTIDKSSYFILDESLTEKLQTQVHHVYSTEINDVLLTGLGLALREVFGVEKSVLKMEGHGREEIIDGIDIGRTVGWFTSVYPFVLDISSSKGDELIGVKESLRRVPNKGVGYGILKYLDKRFANELLPSIQFNYLGDFGTNAGTNKKGESLFEFSSENIGLSSDVSNSQSEVLLDVSGMMVSDQLNMSIRYSGNIFSEETIAKLITAYENQLINLIESLSEIKENRLTPSDLTYNKLSYSDLIELNKDNNIEDIYELSPLQQGLYYYWLVDNSSHMYFNQTAYRLNSNDLNINAVKQAYDELVNRYAILRTSFTNDYSGVPLQIVHKTVSSNFSYESALDFQNIDNYLQDIKEKDKARGFNFEKPTQIRLKVLELGNGDYEFIWSSHHILMDGWCLSILINDFYKILMALNNGKKIQLPAADKYSTYIDWLSKINKDASLSYWKNYLDGLTSITDVPFKKKKKLTNNAIFKSEILQIEGSVFDNIKKVCSDLGITPNTFIQGVWGYLLSRYNNTQDVVFGSVVSGRPGELQGVENMVGLFINTIPVRVKYETTDTVKTFLKRLHLEMLESAPHHYINLSEVQSQSSLGMGLINNLMAFMNYLVQDAVEDENEKDFNEKGQKITLEAIKGTEQNNYDFNINIIPVNSGYKVEFKYDSNALESELILNLISHFSNIVEQFSLREGLSLDKMEYLTPSEKIKLLEDFKGSDLALPIENTFISLFEDQVAKTPDAVAVTFDGKKFTYTELDHLSTQLAFSLRQDYGILKGDMIGIQLNRSEWCIVSILGILKSGAVYIPIDPELPSNRKSFIVEDTDLKLLITETSFIFDLDFYGGNILSIDVEFDPSEEFPESEKVDLSLNDLAYIIYTSGSTGQPKGVMIEHSSLTNYVTWAKEQYLKEDLINTSFGLFTSLSFDLTITSLFLPLISGGTLKILNSADQVPNLLEQYLSDEISCIKLTPAHIGILGGLNLKSDKIEVAIVGGEELRKEHIEILQKINPAIRIYNEYGPTEATVGCMIYEVTSGEEAILIGRPIRNTSIYIVNEFNDLQPEGVTGEICIGGSGLARGYLNRPDLTTDKFVENPFKKGEKIYKTGDLALWMTDGTIDYKGRIDDQVKVRGYRIELGDIETNLKQYSEAIEQALVIIKEVNNEKTVIAYFVSSSEIDKSELRSYLLKNLPEYMVPTFYIEVETIPLTSNGKVDKKALPSVTGEDLIKKEYVAPRNEVEEKLTKVVASILDCKENEIGINDSLFDLGMNSLKLINMVNLIKAELKVVINISMLFEFPNISELSTEIYELINNIDEDDKLSKKDEEEDLLEQFDDFLEQIID